MFGPISAACWASTILQRTNHNDGTFNYEAIYRISHETNAIVSGFDNSSYGDPVNSLILTEQNYHNTNPGQDPVAYFDLQHAQNQYNVGLNKSPAKTQNRPENHYTDLSYGGIIQGGISLAITYRLTFNLGAYYMYQHYENGGNGDNQHITDRIVTDGGGTAANYYGLSHVLKQSDYSSVGGMAGIRIFLGGKGRDTDGDGFIDDVDECPLEWGTAKGCPDDDHDGFRNTTDLCPDVYSLTGGGCPDLDGDGFVDKVDSCVSTPGNIQGLSTRLLERRPYHRHGIGRAERSGNGATYRTGSGCAALRLWKGDDRRGCHSSAQCRCYNTRK